MQGFVPLNLDDVVELRKPHACGGATWRVMRLGTDIGMRCETCQRRAQLPRPEFIRRIRRFIARGATPPGPAIGGDA
jgi:hypothetical protein